MLKEFSLALRQLPAPRFRRVLWRALGLTILLLAALSQSLLYLIPDSISLPWFGEIGWASRLLTWVASLSLLVFSTFVMVPVASLFTGFFLDEVAQAVEDKYYPELPPARKSPLWETLLDSLKFFGLILLVNLFALIIYLSSALVAPVIFWMVNGLLLGREYFVLVAARRMPMAKARKLRSRHFFRIWMAGILMAVPLSIPVVNLFIPLLGVATFTHMYHRLIR